MNRAVFLDKDGTLIKNVPYNVDPALIRLMPGALDGLAALHNAGYLLVVVSNQSGVARGLFPESALGPVEEQLRDLMSEAGAPLAGFYYCPHLPPGEGGTSCVCRKPAPGMLHRAARVLQIDLAQSWMVGDILNDVEAGRRAGCRTVLVDNGGETEWQLSLARTPDIIVGDLAEAAQAILVEPAVVTHLLPLEAAR